uniref:Zinc finger, CCHC-type n=1 Tax=Tanacetum cinerariifolium TaxID=118510 RepID=A0A699GYU3_TANCI|nr:zinc finger, CCHC-type [Tanacetum cinerariifolium]
MIKIGVDRSEYHRRGSTPEPKYVENETLDQIKKRCKWDNDDYICREHILNGMLDALFDIYKNIELAKELRDQLEAKYMAEDTSSKKFLVSNFNNYKMVDSRKTSTIMEGLQYMLKHNKDELSLVQLGSHFRIEETLRMEESGKGKGKEIVGSSFVNMVEDDKNKKNNKSPRETKGSSDDEIAWWIDSGATCHACKDHCWFDTFHPVEDGSVLHMGLRKNLMSGPVLNKCGYKQIYESDNLGLSGCRAVVRLPESKNKILGEKGIDCIFIGYDEHSKAYRFYVIEPNDFISINSVIESRDAIFDENRFSSIPRPKDIISSSNGTQGGDLPSETPIEIPEPRRSNRARVAKSYGFDFQLYLVEGSRDEIASQYCYCYSIEEDPKTFDEAMKSQDKFKCEGCGPVSTPIEAGIKLMPHMGKPVNQLEYSWAIECLMYAITSTRLDIAYAVKKLSRFTSNPSNHHWEAIIRVFSWITNSKDHTSTTGWVFLLGGALAAAGKEAEWLRNLIYEILLWPKPISSISMDCDSAATLAKDYLCENGVSSLQEAMTWLSICS